MIEVIKKIFGRIRDLIIRRKKKIDYDAVVRERWRWGADFPKSGKCRLKEESCDSYDARQEKDSFVFDLKKKHLFAWLENPFFKYSDFIYRCAFRFESSAYSAFGLIFRRADAGNYYSFLVSNRGFYRIDKVFNNNQIPFFPWTPLPAEAAGSVTLEIIGWGSRFIFFINGKRTGDVVDDGFSAGRLSVAAQNYGDADRVSFRIISLEINSNIFDVRNAYVERKKIETPYLRLLAENFFRLGQSEIAAVYFKKYWDSKDAVKNDSGYSLGGEIFFNLKLYDEAASFFEKIKYTDADAFLELGNILYQQGKFDELQKHLESVPPEKKIEESGAYQNLMGHCKYFRGDHRGSAGCYLKAFELDNSNYIAALNAAGSFEKTGDMEKAASLYEKGGILAFRNDSFEDVYKVLDFFERSGIKSFDADVLKAKILFSGSKFKESEALFRRLIKNDKAESDIFYLCGICCSLSGDKKTALSCFEKACDMEDTCALYWRKLAEIRRDMGLDFEKAIERAMENDPDDPEILSFAAECDQREGKMEEAFALMEKALKRDPDDADIRVSYADMLFHGGKEKKAFEILGSADDRSGKVDNEKGLLLLERGDFEKAAESFAEAVKKESGDPVFLKNCAEAYIEADMPGTAEDFLRKLEDIEKSSDVYNLFGNAALLKSDFDRAVAAYREAMKYSSDRTIVLNCVDALCRKRDFKSAGELLKSIDMAGCCDPRVAERYRMFCSRIKKGDGA